MRFIFYYTSFLCEISKKNYIHFFQNLGVYKADFLSKGKFLGIPVMETLMANAMTRFSTVGVTVMKCHEFSSGYNSKEQASKVPSLLQSRFLNYQNKFL